MHNAHIVTARIAGRIIGTTARHAIWLNKQIDWQEVGAIVLHGLQVLIVMTLLAGRYTRRAWDALPVLSERLGKAYASVIAPEQPAAPVVVTVTPVQRLAAQGWSQRRIAKELGISRHAVKRQLMVA